MNPLVRQDAGVWRAAFSLVEIVVATTVIGILSISLLGYVDVASGAWQRGHQKVNLIEFSRTINASLERDISQAIKIYEPKVVDDPGTAGIDERVADHVTYNLPVTISDGTNGKVTLKIQKDGNLLKRYLTNSSFDIQNAEDATPLTADSLKTYRPFYEFTLVRNCATFTVTRVSTWTIQVNYGLLSDVAADETHDSVLEATRTYLMPYGN